MRADDLERRLVAALQRALADPFQIVTAYNALQARTVHPDAGAIDAARRRLAEADAQLHRLARLAPSPRTMMSQNPWQ